MTTQEYAGDPEAIGRDMFDKLRFDRTNEENAAAVTAKEIRRAALLEAATLVCDSCCAGFEPVESANDFVHDEQICPAATIHYQLLQPDAEDEGASKLISKVFGQPVCDALDKTCARADAVFPRIRALEESREVSNNRLAAIGTRITNEVAAAGLVAERVEALERASRPVRHWVPETEIVFKRDFDALQSRYDALLNAAGELRHVVSHEYMDAQPYSEKKVRLLYNLRTYDAAIEEIETKGKSDGG